MLGSVTDLGREIQRLKFKVAGAESVKVSYWHQKPVTVTRLEATRPKTRPRQGRASLGRRFWPTGSASLTSEVLQYDTFGFLPRYNFRFSEHAYLD